MGSVAGMPTQRQGMGTFPPTKFMAVSGMPSNAEAAAAAEVSLSRGVTVRFAGAAAEQLRRHMMARRP